MWFANDFDVPILMSLVNVVIIIKEPLTNLTVNDA